MPTAPSATTPVASPRWPRFSQHHISRNMSYDRANSSTVTEHYRKIFRFGFHPTATRAAMLLRISTSCISSQGCEPTCHEYLLCPFTTEDVLSFCVDTAQVLVVDTADDYSRRLHMNRTPRTFLTHQ
eukprot:PhM_4_TR15703/c4_g3_i2/m.85044